MTPRKRSRIIIAVLLLIITGCALTKDPYDKIRLKTYRDHTRTKVGHYYIYKDDSIAQLRKKIGENEFKIVENVEW